MLVQNFLIGAVLGLALLGAEAQGFAVRTRTITELEMGPVKFLEIQHGEETFSLVPPSDWRLETDASLATLRFYAPKGGGVLTLQFCHAHASEALATAETLKKSTVPHLGEARVLEEFPAYAGDKTGKGIDLSHTLHGHAMRVRAAVIGLGHGYASFVLNCGVNDFKTSQQVFGSLLSSFQRTPTPVAR